MSADGTAWGTCAAFGCPLLGVYGESGSWYCLCHARKDASLNDPITLAIKRNIHLVKATRDIRFFFGRREWPEVFAGIEKLLADAGHPEMRFSAEVDSSPRRPGRPIVQQWLARLETALLDAVADIGHQQSFPTAGVAGPTHAEHHFTETDA